MDFEQGSRHVVMDIMMAFWEDADLWLGFSSLSRGM